MQRLSISGPILLALCVGCKDKSAVDVDYGLDPSPFTVDEGVTMLANRIPISVYKNKITTTPILMKSGEEFHWTMKDGDIWILFENDPKYGAVIVGFRHAYTK